MVQQENNLKKLFFFSHSLVASTMHSSNDTGKYLGEVLSSLRSGSSGCEVTKSFYGEPSRSNGGVL